MRVVTLCLDSAAARVAVSPVPVLCVLSPLELSMGLRDILQCPEKGTSQRFQYGEGPSPGMGLL